MMKDFTVEIPIAGSMKIRVQASSKEEAIELAWEKIDEYTPENEDFEFDWEYFEVIADGNVLGPSCNRVTAREE